ncbi:antibiotic biosynthesis monooxygenase [Nocardioides alkalitolerans]|uniref:antibiotic biosynthesis monooxygenase n=1 Tax=Nocardioides alkalitolerans TaxID=281714 RepID=UPI0004249DE6|nr:antibiotic biosynthesis monooxygenase [Nocardioides alkalitolerans]
MSAPPHDPPVVEMQVWGVDRVLPALGRMATGRRRLRGVDGLRFAKLLGTGSGRSFTPRDADPHHWAVLTVWDDDAAADAWRDSALVRSWDAAAHESLRVRMTPLTSRGRWSGVEPFGSEPFGSGPAEPWSGPVASVTRARLRPTRALSFWRAVPPVVTALHETPGLELALGVGEAPVGLQGTFSLWRSSADLVAFAYGGAAHRDVVRRTAPSRWYAEELFARLAVHEVEGTHGGRTW